jgi:hypothetical protein
MSDYEGSSSEVSRLGELFAVHTKSLLLEVGKVSKSPSRQKVGESKSTARRRGSCEKIAMQLAEFNVTMWSVEDLMNMEPKEARQMLNDAKKTAREVAKSAAKAQKETAQKGKLFAELNSLGVTYGAQLAAEMTIPNLRRAIKEEKLLQKKKAQQEKALEKAKAKAAKVKTPKGPSKRVIMKTKLLHELATLTDTTKFLDAKIPEIRKEIKRIQKERQPKKQAKAKVPETQRRLSLSIEGKPDILGKNGAHLRIAIHRENRTCRMVNPNNWTDEAKEMLAKAHPDGKVHPKKRGRSPKKPAGESKIAKVDLLAKQLQAEVAAAANNVLNESHIGGESKHNTAELEEDEINEMSDMSDDEDDEPEFPGHDEVKPLELPCRPGELLYWDDSGNTWNTDQVYIGITTNVAGELLFSEI